MRWPWTPDCWRFTCTVCERNVLSKNPPLKLLDKKPVSRWSSNAEDFVSVDDWSLVDVCEGCFTQS